MTLFLVGLVLTLVGGTSVALTSRSRRPSADVLYQVLVVTGCAMAAIDAARVLASGTPVSAAMRATTPGGDWHIGIDALSAVFLLALLGVGAMCALFGTHDLAREREGQRVDAPTHRSTWVTQFAFAVLLVAIALVVVARTVVVFMGAWEVMAISSYVLIVTHYEDAEVRRAGLIYLVATHTATLALFAMFAVLQTSAADWSFGAFAAAAPSLNTGAAAAVLLLALVGFGFKAGAVPLHIWLPPAHAVAPSHVSALMSGIVIKTGIYGLLRVLLILGGAPAWWGWLVLGIGVASAVLGVLWALAQHDMKRLLAYHSVENIGIILMGIGVGVLGAATGAPAIAMLGFAGGLLHTVNHALFKSLLFLGAGAVYRATGTRNLEELGGLARRMPITWLGFAVGAAAIIGVPPFNGFVSEWLVYQGLFSTGQAGDPTRVALLGIPALALTGALALACFAKVAGVVFLGVARSTRAREAVESGRGMHGPMLALAATCIVLGVVPALGISLVSATARELSGIVGAALPGVVVSGARMLSLLALAILGSSALLWGIRHAFLRRRIVRYDTTWTCGYSATTPRMQYTAASFASPLLDVFGRLSGTRVERSPLSVHTRAVDLVLDGMTVPLWRALQRTALRLRAIQQGRLHVYLIYVLAALLVLLGYLALGPRP